MAYICNNNKPFVTESQKPSCIRLKKHRPPHLGGCPCKTFSTKEQVKMGSPAESPLYPLSFPTSPRRQGKKKLDLLPHPLPPPNFFTSSSQIYSPRRHSFPRKMWDQSVLLIEVPQHKKEHQYWRRAAPTYRNIMIINSTRIGWKLYWQQTLSWAWRKAAKKEEEVTFTEHL